MDRGDQPNFHSHNEEIEYWKNLAMQFMNEKDAVQREFEDYMMESQQLEKEYEITIEQNEKKLSEFKSAALRMQNELESLRIKLEENNRERDILENELCFYKKDKTEYQKKIRELEQKNDDLERSQRMISESIADFEAALNSAIERNAILESEIDEKETLREKVQRLTDEARDLKQELHVRERPPDNERILNGHIDSNRLKVEHETQTTPLKRDPNINIDPQFSPSSRIIALNIVGDLLRKMGNLEAKLGQNRNGYRDNNMETRRTRHPATTTRGRTSPSIQGFTK